MIASTYKMPHTLHGLIQGTSGSGKSPLAYKFPYYSPYHFAGNSPISNFDLDGGEDISYLYKQNNDGLTLVNKVDYRSIGDGSGGSKGHGIQVTIINNKGEIRTDFTPTHSFSNETPTFANRIGKSLEGLGAKGDRFITSLKGNTIGEGENLVNTGKLGLKGKVTFNKYSVGFDLNAFASSESAGGLALELNYEVNLKAGAKGLSAANFEIGAGLEGYVSGSTGTVNEEIKSGGIISENKNILTIQAGGSTQGANVYYTQEINLDKGTHSETGTISVGKTSNSIGYKNKSSITFSTGETKITK